MSLFNLKKFVGTIFNQPEEQEEQDLIKLGDQLKNADLDYKFAQLFTHSGGYFNYCADEAEALQTLNHILKLEEIKSVFCWDHELKNFLDVINTPYTAELELFNDCAFITCEYLIAYDGRIMLSHNNILHYHSSRLPEKIIMMANVSQIVTNLNDAMGKIKRNGNIRNLTSISGRNSKLDTPNKDNTKLFLLLLED
ncbi:LUD domain-containing protein [Kaistella yonginensis]|uniref:LUD domain-containing protein n=1 Tax=Kaistella yonginensis TaxID=658267 RepID=UPI0025B54536|nr:LUD domain-containing protein [Kaistella yonginensis]MDN3607527.1 LUD domain-containing protein [Kaistella yonginensis]